MKHDEPKILSDMQLGVLSEIYKHSSGSMGISARTIKLVWMVLEGWDGIFEEIKGEPGWWGPKPLALVEAMEAES